MKLALSILVFVLIIAGFGLWWRWHGDAANANAAPMQTAKVERKSLQVTVESQGSVASNRDVDIKCKASGNILELPYNVSQDVPPGALLLRLDTVDQKRLVDQAEAQVNADQARLNEANLNWEIAKKNLVTTRQRSEAALESAKAKAADARAKAERTRQLFESKLASQEDLETAQTAAAGAQAAEQDAIAAVAELEQDSLAIDAKAEQIKQMSEQLKQDLAKRDTALQNMKYCEVFAPQADDAHKDDPPQWRVSTLTKGVDIGYLVQSGSSGNSGGTTVMQLADLSHIFVLATVNESDIGSLKDRFDAGAQLRATITTDTYKNQNLLFHGKVVRIATAGISTSNVVTFEVKIEVTDPNYKKLLPNMTADVKIVVDERADALIVPVSAVSRKPFERRAPASQPASEAGASTAASAPLATRRGPGGGGGRRGNGGAGGRPDQYIVTVVKPDGSTEVRDVTLGITDDVSYEVLSGLEEGETVQIARSGGDSRYRGGGGQGGGGGGPRGMMRGMGR